MHDHQFKVGDLAVYPAYGVAQVEGIETRELGGTMSTIYVLRVLETNMKVMVPITKVEQVGLRDLVDEEDVEAVYEILNTRELSVEQTTWNRRAREYTEKIRTGSIFEVAEVMRDLCLLRNTKSLSFGEKRMLNTAQGLLLKELGVARQVDDGDNTTLDLVALRSSEAELLGEFDEIFLDATPA